MKLCTCRQAIAGIAFGARSVSGVSRKGSTNAGSAFNRLALDDDDDSDFLPSDFASQFGSASNPAIALQRQKDHEEFDLI